MNVRADQSDRFEKIATLLMRLEGGYVHDQDDPGGETKYGISKRAYPTIDIAGLSEADARAIYQQDWWEKYGYARLPSPVGELLFLLAVNMGAVPAHAILQRALADLDLPVQTTDLLGEVVIQSASIYPHQDVLLALIRSGAIERYRRLGKPRFMAGWVRRAMTPL